MKNACIVIRNKRKHFSGDEFEPIADALADGGFPIDKFFILSEEEEHEFSQTVIECKNFFDNSFVLAPEARMSAMRASIASLLKATGTGILLETGKKNFICLPFGGSGVALARGEALPQLKEKYAVTGGSAFVRGIGIPSEKLKSVLTEAEAVSKAIRFSVQESHGDFRIEIVYGDESKAKVDEVQRILASGLNDFVYAIDDTPLNRRIYELLKLRGAKLSVAESFTGGGVASKLIEIPGVSDVLYESVVAYDNGAKQSRLHVSPETLAKQGAVSDETAYEMAAGLLATGKCTLAVATTGIAGPGSDQTEKPVGLCYIAAGGRETIYVYKYMFKGTREEITKRAINQAMFLLYKQIK